MFFNGCITVRDVELLILVIVSNPQCNMSKLKCGCLFREKGNENCETYIHVLQLVSTSETGVQALGLYDI